MPQGTGQRMFNSALIIELVKRDFTERFSGSILGSAWAVIFPIVNLAIYIIVFGKIMGGRLAGESYLYSYSVYLTVGLLPWTAFANTLARSTSVFIDTKHLISKMQISLPSLLVYIALSETITFMVTMVFFLVFLLGTDFQFSMKILLLPVLLYLQQVFAFGLGMFAATLTVFIKDCKQAVSVLLQVWFWVTPIVYLKEILPVFLKKLLLYNPMYVIIDSYQTVFIPQHEINYFGLAIMAVFFHGIVIAAFMIFRALEKDIRDFL
jgi:lipopolysaccharide transport system permease protein